MGKLVKRIIIAIIVSIALVVFLISQIDLDDVYLIINNLRPVYFVFAFLVFLLSQFLRAARFKFLSNGSAGLLSFFKITSIGVMANQILPARTGELSYPYLFKKVHGLSMGRGISVLISARILDLFIVIIFFLSSLFLVIENQAVKAKVFILGAVAFLIAILIFLLLFFAGFKILKLIKKLIRLIKIQNHRFVNYIYKGLEKVINNLSVIKSPKTFFPLILFSFSIWLTMYFWAFLSIRSLGLELNFLESVFVATFCFITSILPIHSLVGFGTTEGSWAIGMLLLGYSKGIAIASGFGFHIIVLFFALITALYSIITIKFKK